MKIYCCLIIILLGCTNGSVPPRWLNPSDQQIIETYTINTYGICQGRTPTSHPVCSIETLNRRIGRAQDALRNAMNDIQSRINSSSAVCNLDAVLSYQLESSFGSSFEGTLMSGMEIMTQIALNVSVTNCYTIRGSGSCSSNVQQSILDVLCEIKGLLRFVPIDQSLYNARMTFPSMGRTQFILFTCENLRRAFYTIGNLKDDINRKFRNISQM